jgi:hypothetical protein
MRSLLVAQASGAAMVLLGSGLGWQTHMHARGLQHLLLQAAQV